MPPHRRPQARGLEVGLGGDAVEAVVEQVADVGEQLEQRDRRVGDREVGVGVLAQQVLDQRLAQRAPVAGEVVVHGRRRRGGAAPAAGEAAAEVRALGPQPHGQPGAQRVEVGTAGRAERPRAGSAPGRAAPASVELDVRRRAPPASAAAAIATGVPPGGG